MSDIQCPFCGGTKKLQGTCPDPAQGGGNHFYRVFLTPGASNIPLSAFIYAPRVFPSSFALSIERNAVWLRKHNSFISEYNQYLSLLISETLISNKICHFYFLLSVCTFLSFFLCIISFLQSVCPPSFVSACRSMLLFLFISFQCRLGGNTALLVTAATVLICVTPRFFPPD